MSGHDLSRIPPDVLARLDELAAITRDALDQSLQEVREELSYGASPEAVGPVAGMALAATVPDFAVPILLGHALVRLAAAEGGES